jgi:hypothetical protein
MYLTLHSGYLVHKVQRLDSHRVGYMPAAMQLQMRVTHHGLTPAFTVRPYFTTAQLERPACFIEPYLITKH